MRAWATVLLPANFFPIRHIVVNRAERKKWWSGPIDREPAEKSASWPPFSGGNSTPLTQARAIEMTIRKIVDARQRCEILSPPPTATAFVACGPRVARANRTGSQPR